jgi:MFS transporter, DHA2 family, methylenomycin A resistance protein
MRAGCPAPTPSVRRAAAWDVAACARPLSGYEARVTREGSPADRSPSDRRWTLLAACLGFAVVQLDVSVVNVAIKPIGEELGGGVEGLQWVVSAYTITFAALILTAGALGDRIGAKRVFVAGFVVFTLASAACGLAPSLAVLIAARAVQGVGAAILVPCSLTLLNHVFSEPDERARAVGLWAAGASVALAGGPLVGGVLIAALDWRAIFFINAPIGLFAIALTLRWAPETSRSDSEGIDLPGQLTAIGSLAALAGATIEGGAHGFASPAVLVGYAVAFLLAAAFVRIEARSREPMLPLGLFESPTFGAASAIGFLVNVAFYGLIFVFSLYFQEGRGYSAIDTGLAFVPATAAVMAGNLIAGRAAGRFSARTVLVAGALSMAVALVALLGIGSQTAYLDLVVQLTVLGLGLGLIVPVMTSSLLGSVGRERSGVASGTLNTARQAGSVIGVALFGSLIGGNLVSGLHLALAISIGLSLACAAAALAVE